MAWLADAAKGTPYEDKIASQDPKASEVEGILDEARGYADYVAKNIDVKALLARDPETQRAWYQDANRFGDTILDLGLGLAGLPFVGKAFGALDQALKSIFGEAHGKIPPPPPRNECIDELVWEEYAARQQARRQPVKPREVYYAEYIQRMGRGILEGNVDLAHDWAGTAECRGMLRRLTDPTDVGFDGDLAQAIMRELEKIGGGRFVALEYMGPDYQFYDKPLGEWPQWMPLGQPEPLSDVFLLLAGKHGWEDEDFAALALMPASYGLPEKPLSELSEAERERYFAQAVMILAANNAGSPTAFWNGLEKLKVQRKRMGLDGCSMNGICRRWIAPGSVENNIITGVVRATKELGPKRDEIRKLFSPAEQSQQIQKEQSGWMDGSIGAALAKSAPYVLTAVGIAGLGALIWKRVTKKRGKR